MFGHPEFDNHETVVFSRDREAGLTAIIAVHSTGLGPASAAAACGPTRTRI